MKDAIVTIRYNGKEKTVSRAGYSKAKCKQLREFGYPDLTVDEVEQQIDALLSGKPFGAGLTVIGMLMQDELLKGGGE